MIAPRTYARQNVSLYAVADTGTYLCIISAAQLRRLSLGRLNTLGEVNNAMNKGESTSCPLLANKSMATAPPRERPKTMMLSLHTTSTGHRRFQRCSRQQHAVSRQMRHACRCPVVAPAGGRAPQRRPA